MAVDVGLNCPDEDSNDNGAANYTVVEHGNPSASDGSIDEVCIYTEDTISGMEFAAFDHEGSNALTTSDDCDGANLSASSGVNTYNAPGDFTAFSINSGGFIGYFKTNGTLRRTNGGSNGYWYVSGDEIPCTSTTFTLNNSSDIWIGANLASGGLSIPVAMRSYRNRRV